jgi:hypothetical protein
MHRDDLFIKGCLASQYPHNQKIVSTVSRPIAIGFLDRCACHYQPFTRAFIIATIKMSAENGVSVPKQNIATARTVW